MAAKTPLDDQRARLILNRRLKKKFDQHREILEKHKERGPVFKEAVERLERILANLPNK